MGRRNEIPNLIKKCMLFLAGMQVFLGVIWLICSLTHMPDYQETRDMLEASQTLIIDEYMGILYPLLLRLFSVFGKYFYVPVYLFQVGMAVWSYHYLLRSMLGEKRRVWLLVGYLVTFPFILQCHMSLLPYSLATSLLMFLVAETKRLTENGGMLKAKRFIMICILWLLEGLLLPDYGIIAAVIVVPGLVLSTWKQRKRMLLYLCMAALTMSTIFATLTLTQTPGSYGRMQRSVNSVLWSRFAWPHFDRDGFYWDFKEWIEFGDGEWGWISMYPEHAIYELGPKIERLAGTEQADVIYGEMAALSFNMGMKEALKNLGRDIIANAGGPFALQYQLSGKGVSYTAWNYYQMQGNVPGLTKYFVRFAIYGFDFLFVLALGINWMNRKSRKREKVQKIVPALLGLGVMILWYTMIGNGMQDYLKVIPVSICWCMLPMLGLNMLTETQTEKAAE